MKVCHSKKQTHMEGPASYQLVDWNTGQTPTGGSSEEFCAMAARLTQQRRVGDEGLRVVKPCQVGRKSRGRTGFVFDGTTRGSTG